jgi:hypothetical protein
MHIALQIVLKLLDDLQILIKKCYSDEPLIFVHLLCKWFSINCKYIIQVSFQNNRHICIMFLSHT